MIPLMLLASLAAAGPTKDCRRGDAHACIRAGDALSSLGREGAAARWYRRACHARSPATCTPLLQHVGEGAHVIAEAQRRCELGDGVICRQLARFYGGEGPSSSTDPDEALLLYETACGLQQGSACDEAAWIHARGTRVEPDQERANTFFAVGCRLGNGPSCRTAAHRTLNGVGTPPDPTAAYRVLQQSCHDAEDAESCEELGTWRQTGRGLAADPSAAAAAFARGCRSGSDEACADAAEILRSDGAGLRDVQEALVAACATRGAGACGHLRALAEEGHLPSVQPEDLEAAQRVGPLPLCLAGRADACRAGADMQSDPRIAAQLRAHATHLDHVREAWEITSELTPPSWRPDVAAVRACLSSEIDLLVTPDTAGRLSFSAGLDAAAEHLERTLAELGLEVTRQAVVLPPFRFSTRVEVDGHDVDAIAAPGSAVGVMRHGVRVLDGPPKPSDLADDPRAIVFGVPRLTPGAVPWTPASIPVVAVQSDDLEQLRTPDAQIRLAALPANARPVSDNIIGVLPGSGSLAAEAVVLGAHYDALGRTDAGVVRPGADDNASGVAGMVCLARVLATRLRAERDHRTVVFAAFTGEEQGLYGSTRYVWDPVHPTDSTVAMMGLDMIGRASEGGLWTRAYSRELWELISAASSVGPRAKRDDEPGAGGSDHLAFVHVGVPSLHLWTGTHGDYHRPTDTTDRLDLAGAAQVTSTAGVLLHRLVIGPTPERTIEDTCVEGVSKPLEFGVARFGGRSPTVRCIPAGAPAQAIGLQVGDRIIGRNRWAAGRGWPAEPVEVFVDREGTCLRLRAGEAATLACDAVPEH